MSIGGDRKVETEFGQNQRNQQKCAGTPGKVEIWVNQGNGSKTRRYLEKPEKYEKRKVMDFTY